MPRNRSEKAPPAPTFPNDNPLLVELLRHDAVAAFSRKARPAQYDNGWGSDAGTALMTSGDGHALYQRAWTGAAPSRRNAIFLQLLEHLYATQSK